MKVVHFTCYVTYLAFRFIINEFYLCCNWKFQMMLHSLFKFESRVVELIITMSSFQKLFTLFLCNHELSK